MMQTFGFSETRSPTNTRLKTVKSGKNSSSDSDEANSFVSCDSPAYLTSDFLVFHCIYTVQSVTPPNLKAS